MAANGEIEIKQGSLLKRSINRSTFTNENYRTRLFVLSRTHLRYFDGKPPRRGKEKGKIALEHVKVIEEVEDRMLDNRDNVFQIVYKQSSDTYTLYIVAVDNSVRQEWIEAIRAECKLNGARFLPKYHKGVWTKGRGKYNCCDQIDRNAPGCEMVENTHTSSVTEPHGGMRQPLPPPPRMPDPTADEPEKIFIAVYDFEPAEDGDLELIRGEEYVILNDSKEHWWQARDKHGNCGYIPSNYVKQRYGLEVYGWYYKDLTRNRSEMILQKGKIEGCFLVRDSTSTPGLYTVSVYTGDGTSIVKHYHIHKNEQGKFYISNKHCFDNIPDLIHYHRHNSGGLSTRLRDPPERDNKPSTAGMGHSKWEVDPSELKMGELLGAGCFGSVYQGILKGKAVAVKTLKEMAMSENSFIEEAKTMTQLSHPNLVQLYGIVTEKKPLMIVTELMRYGALITYLKRHSEILNKPGDMLDYCVQVCSGMVYLEQRKFIHRDLAARNCLVGENKVVKVADFGLTRYVIDDEYTSSVGTKFPVKWAPPEVLSYTRFSSKSDIWAFGVLMWEIFTAGEMPYGKMKNSDVVEYVVNQNKRLQKPRAAPDIIYKIMKKCWEFNAESRPSFSDLLIELKGLADKSNYPQTDMFVFDIKLDRRDNYLSEAIRKVKVQ